MSSPLLQSRRQALVDATAGDRRRGEGVHKVSEWRRERRGSAEGGGVEGNREKGREVGRERDGGRNGSGN